jgi:hypothetical protein
MRQGYHKALDEPNVQLEWAFGAEYGPRQRIICDESLIVWLT